MRQAVSVLQADSPSEEQLLLRRFGYPPVDPSVCAKIDLAVFSRLKGARGALLCAACRHLYLARSIHSDKAPTPESVLLGDYFLSRAIHCLAQLDCAKLQTEFSRFLAQDASSSCPEKSALANAIIQFAGEAATWIEPA